MPAASTRPPMARMNFFTRAIPKPVFATAMQAHPYNARVGTVMRFIIVLKVVIIALSENDAGFRCLVPYN
jgi:hypothetical protein